MTNRRVALRRITSVAVLTSEPEHFQQHDEWQARAFIDDSDTHVTAHARCLDLPPLHTNRQSCPEHSPTGGDENPNAWAITFKNTLPSQGMQANVFVVCQHSSSTGGSESHQVTIKYSVLGRSR
jgi:hypothetical protein